MTIRQKSASLIRPGSDGAGFAVADEVGEASGPAGFVGDVGAADVVEGGAVVGGAPATVWAHPENASAKTRGEATRSGRIDTIVTGYAFTAFAIEALNFSVRRSSTLSHSACIRLESLIATSSDWGCLE